MTGVLIQKAGLFAVSSDMGELGERSVDLGVLRFACAVENCGVYRREYRFKNRAADWKKPNSGGVVKDDGWTLA